MIHLARSKKKYLPFLKNKHALILQNLLTD